MVSQSNSGSIKNQFVCGVCELQPKKYKCPKCGIFYCSLLCFQTHRQDTHTCNEIYNKALNLPCLKSNKISVIGSLPVTQTEINLAVPVTTITSSTLECLREGIDEDEWLAEEQLLGVLHDQHVVELLQNPTALNVISAILKTNSGSTNNQTKYQIQNLIKLQDHLVATHPIQLVGGDTKSVAGPRHPLYEVVPAVLNSLGR